MKYDNNNYTKETNQIQGIPCDALMHSWKTQRTVCANTCFFFKQGSFASCHAYIGLESGNENIMTDHVECRSEIYQHQKLHYHPGYTIDII